MEAVRDAQVLNQAVGALSVHSVKEAMVRIVKSSIARTAKAMCSAGC